MTYEWESKHVQQSWKLQYKKASMKERNGIDSYLEFHGNIILRHNFFSGVFYR